MKTMTLAEKGPRACHENHDGLSIFARNPVMKIMTSLIYHRVGILGRCFQQTLTKDRAE